MYRLGEKLLVENHKFDEEWVWNRWEKRGVCARDEHVEAAL